MSIPEEVKTCPHVAGLSGMCMACAMGEEKKPGPREERIAFLERKRTVTIEDLKVKAEGEDWHGVQDCGSDLRDIDNELSGLRFGE